MKLILNCIFILLITSFVSCGSSMGGTEAGNPSMRNVIGQFQSASASQNLNSNGLYQSTNCPIDMVIAINSVSETFEFESNDACNFTLTLPINASYAINFINNNEFIAAMIFNNSSNAISSSTFVLSAGNTDIDLGLISVNGRSAFPQSQPAEQNDYDDDGTFDFEDDDFRTEDCDLDGHYDDFDYSDDDCDIEDNTDDNSTQPNDDNNNSQTASVLNVFPANNESNIDIDESIEVLFGCDINFSTVSDATFFVTNESNSVTCEFSTSSSNQIIECEPQDGLEANTNYTVQIDGIECESGTPIPETEWTFTTEDE